MARSRLYQSRFLQRNTHFAAFSEIYKIHKPLHRSKFKIFSVFAIVCNFSVNFGDFYKSLLTFAANDDGIHSTTKQAAPASCKERASFSNSFAALSVTA